MISRLVAASAVCLLWAGGYALDQKQMPTQAERACITATEEGAYTDEMWEQCLADYADSRAPVPCEEDMPCWDCTSMGNRICGPLGPKH